jgi:hypothetical protein
MWLFGRARWLCHGEVFTLVFGLLARFAPTEVRDSGAGGRELNLRPYGVGLLPREPVSNSILVLVLAMLAAVCFDGFTETPLWANIVEYYAPPARIPGSTTTRPRGADCGPDYAPLRLRCLPCLRRPSPGRAGMSVPAGHRGMFVLTLVPIAIATTSRITFHFWPWRGNLIPLASDPFGFGWNLFGTKNYFIGIGLVDARAVWYISIAAIVIGHIVAVYLAHVCRPEGVSRPAIALRANGDMSRCESATPHQPVDVDRHHSLNRIPDATLVVAWPCRVILSSGQSLGWARIGSAKLSCQKV